MKNIFSKEYQQNKFKELATKNNVSVIHQIKFIKIANIVEKFIFATLKFLALLWIFSKYYKTAGFDKVIITLLVIIITILISQEKENRFKI